MDQGLRESVQRAGPSDPISRINHVDYYASDAVRADEIVEKSKGSSMINKSNNDDDDDDARTHGEEEEEEEEDKCASHVVIDMKDVSIENQQKLCRICHLSEKESGKDLKELMEIGCGCKGELGLAHSYCAEAWFRVKGNRLCEICGETAKNIKGVVDNRFMEEWNEGISSGDGNMSQSTSNGGGGSRRCLSRQPLCNFLMACLVIAFVLPWFFRVNMF